MQYTSTPVAKKSYYSKDDFKELPNTHMFSSSLKSATRGSVRVSALRYAGESASLSKKRVMNTIKMGKARPAIFHQFETFVELSDGSVIRRRSQAPKDEVRMISDQRSSTLWNPTRDDLDDTDPNAVGKVDKFKKRFGGFDGGKEVDEELSILEKRKHIAKQKDDLFELLGENATEVNKGGKVQAKWESNKKKK